MKTNYIPVIGLEIHVELKTQSKMFCQCNADYFGKKPNTQVCPVCLGLPGALPVPNKKAIDWTILIGRALNCQINKVSKFDRKHYFYPDLPKGYQISQYDEPIATKGWLELKINPPGGGEKLKIEKKVFKIRRVHLEEDTGKLLHVGSETLIDFNRSGVPLVEIVTEPNFNNADDVKKFLEELQVIIRYLGISDADMEKGSMRLEPNISLKKFKLQNSKFKIKEEELPKYKVEIKNINSFRFVKQAIEYEIKRQIDILEKGKIPKQETRGFNAEKGITYSLRAKEEAYDYRYFPEPDIPPLKFSKEYIDAIKIPELPQKKVERYVNNFKIKYQDAFVLTRNKEATIFFEKAISKLKSQISKPNLKTENLPQTIVNFIVNKKIPINISLDEFINKVIEILSPKQTDEKLLDTIIDRLIIVHKKAVEDYKKGKENAIMFLVGQAMKEMKGQAEAKLIISKLKSKISKLNLKS